MLINHINSKDDIPGKNLDADNLVLARCFANIDFI